MTTEHVRVPRDELRRIHEHIITHGADTTAANMIDAILSRATPSDEGEVVVTKNEQGQIVAVTRQNEDGQILSVIAESKPSAPRVVTDGCTESNCRRCLTHPNHRGDMPHAGISDFSASRSAPHPEKK